MLRVSPTEATQQTGYDRSLESRGRGSISVQLRGLSGVSSFAPDIH